MKIRKSIPHLARIIQLSLAGQRRFAALRQDTPAEPTPAMLELQRLPDFKEAPLSPVTATKS